MVNLAFGFAVLFSAWMAHKSKVSVIRCAMCMLFLGWVVYQSTDKTPLTNLLLDSSLLLGVAWSRWIQRDKSMTSLCSLICAIFAAMLCLHAARIMVDFSNYVYYMTCNLLFLAQLLLVNGYSIAAMLDRRSLKNIKKRSAKWEHTQKKLQSSSRSPICTKQVLLISESACVKSNA